MNNDLISREALIKEVCVKFYTTPYYKHILDVIDNAPTVDIPNYGGQVVPDMLQGWRYEERQTDEILQKIPKDFVYDTETSEFYCYRNKYTGEEIHIIKSPKTYILERPQGEWKLHGMIYYCSECGHDYEQGGNNFCGNCGADMRGGAE